MKDHNFILVFEGVDPAVDLDATHGRFLDAGMDISTLSGRLEHGYLALDVTTYDDPAPESLIKAIRLARQVLGSGRLSEVAPDIVDRKELSIRTGIEAPNLQRYIKQPWFPNPVTNGRCYRLDDAVEALRQHTRVEIEDADSLIESARAARLVNAELALLSLSANDDLMRQHLQAAVAALA